MECKLIPKRSLFQLFPIRDNTAWDFYQQQMKSFWTVAELDFGEDRQNATELLSEDENRVLMKVLAFFAASDLIVNERLFLSLFDEAPTSEWRAALTAQSFFETIHSETYALLIDTLCPDENSKRSLFNSLETEHSISAKRDWYLKNSVGSYAQRCLVQLCVEGIHFSSSFAIIAWLRKRFPGKFQATCKSNELIMRDEGMHAKMAAALYRQCEEQLSVERVKELIKEAVIQEQNFVEACFNGKRLWGINSDSLCTHVQFIADYWLVYLNMEREYNVQSQFDWLLESSTMEGKSNFFEERVTEYTQGSIIKMDISEAMKDTDF